MASMRRGARMSEMPSRSPKRDDHARTVRGISDQTSCSSSVGRKRWMFRPQCRSRSGLKRSCENGIHSSAVHRIRVDGRLRAPDQVVSSIEAVFGIGGVIAIDAHAGGGDAEHDRGATIEKRVESRPGCIRPDRAVATAERGLDRAVAACHPCADVQRVAVIHETHVHRIGGCGAFGRLLLNEVDDGRRLLPRLVVQAAVDANRAIGHTGRGGLLSQRR